MFSLPAAPMYDTPEEHACMEALAGEAMNLEPCYDDSEPTAIEKHLAHCKTMAEARMADHQVSIDLASSSNLYELIKFHRERANHHSRTADIISAAYLTLKNWE